MQSAFVYAGQKCSAASRVLVHEAIADAVLERLAGAVDVLVVGQADRFGVDVPPVIEQEARERIERYRALAAEGGRIVAERREGVAGEGWFVAPTVASDLPADSPVLQEEIFGPLLAVERVASVEAACDRVDELPFALTGGPVRPQPAHRPSRGAALAGGQPLRQPPDHGRDGRAPAVRRQPPVGHRDQGRRP